MEIVIKKPTIPGTEKPGCEHPPAYRGKPGPQGPAGTIEIAQVVTIEPSDPARVENIGDSTNAKLILYIPKGDAGNRGEPGPAVEITEDIIQSIVNELDLTPEFIGLGNVDNTSDMDKPVSTAQAAAIADAKKAGTDAQGAIDTHVADKNNPHGVTIAQIGAAPSGYGLGTSGASTNNLDNATASGWYYYSTRNLTTVLPTGFGNGVVEVINRAGTQVIQKITDIQGWMVQRIYVSDSWGPWEWENPPMVAGVEYRTTERFEDKVVYTKAVNLGTLPTKGSAIHVSHGVSATKIIRITAVASGGTTIPYGYDLSSGLLINIGATTSVINVWTANVNSGDFSGSTGTAQIWYTKD